MHCSKFATAHQHFLLLLQKKTLAKEKEPEGISISPQTPLNRPEKPLRFFWTFPAIAENPMRIRTTLWTFSAGYFAAVIQTQLLTNPLFRIRRRAAETRKVTTEWNAKLKYWCLPEFGCRTHQTHPSTLFSPIFSLAREKIGPSETSGSHKFATTSQSRLRRASSPGRGALGCIRSRWADWRRRSRGWFF